MIFLPLTNSYAEKLPTQYGDKVTVYAEITNLKINYNGGFADFNDPFGFNTGEVALLYSFSESGHTYKIEEEMNLSDWDLQWHDSVPHNQPTTGREKINKQFTEQIKYVHVECYPIDKLETVFTVYNVNGRWPDWEGILVDSAKAAGFATLRELAIATGYVAAEHLTLGGLAVAALASVAIQNIILTIRGNESLGIGTLEVDLNELEYDEGKTFVVTTDATQYGSAEITFLVKKTTEDIPCSDVTQSNISLNDEQFYALLNQELTNPEIPGWIKNNAEWWADGTISDREFVSAIGYLVKEDIIHVNVPVNQDGSIIVSENLRMPEWIKKNAEWWADDAISNIEFLTAIEYMINQKIISFNDKKTNVDLTPELLIKAYSASKWDELAAEITVKVKNYELEIFNKLAKKGWSEYAVTKNESIMNEARILEEKKRVLEKETTLLLDIFNQVKENSEYLKLLAQEEGASTFELNSAIKNQNEKVLQIDSIPDLKDRIKKAKDALKNGDNIRTEITLDYCDTWSPGTGDCDSTAQITPGESVCITDNGGRYKASDMDEQCISDTLEIVLDKSLESVKEQCNLGNLNCEYECEEPSCIEPYSEESDNNEYEKKEDGRTVVVLTIGSKYYPLSQFHEVSAHAPNCDALHYHSEFTNVRSTDGTHISDINKTTCGFGKVGLIPLEVVTMTSEEIDAFKQEMGFEP